MLASFSHDLFDRLVKSGLELVDTGCAKIVGDLRTDVVCNVEHAVQHQMEYINISWSEELGFYAEKTPLGIFTYFMNAEKKEHNEKVFNRAVNEHIAFLNNIRKNTINIISEHIKRMECEDILPALVILPERFKYLHITNRLFGVEVSYLDSFWGSGALFSSPQFGRFFTFPLFA